MDDKLESRIPQLAAKRGFTKQDFTADCIKAGISYFTAIKLWNGDPNLTLRTLVELRKVLHVSSINELVEFI